MPTLTVTFVQATFVLAIFVHIRNTSAVTDPNLTKLKEGSWDHLSQRPTVTVTFVQATFVLATFVHIRNISAVTDPILTKLFGPDFLQALNFFGPKILLTQSFFGLKKILT